MVKDHLFFLVDYLIKFYIFVIQRLDTYKKIIKNPLLNRLSSPDFEEGFLFKKIKYYENN